MKIHELLRLRGLTDNEILIYEALLDHGASHAGFLAQRTGIHRRNLYDGLDRLIKKGMIGYIKENNRRVYELLDPQYIATTVQAESTAWNAILPQLQSQIAVTQEKRETLVFRGKQGVQKVFEDQLEQREEILVNATSTNVTGILRHFFPKYNLLRKQEKIPTRMLFDATYQTKENKTELRAVPLCTTRFVEGLNKSPMAQYIYGNTVALIVWSDNPLAIVMREQAIADGFRAGFEVLWKSAK